MRRVLLALAVAGIVILAALLSGCHATPDGYALEVTGWLAVALRWLGIIVGGSIVLALGVCAIGAAWIAILRRYALWYSWLLLFAFLKAPKTWNRNLIYRALEDYMGHRSTQWSGRGLVDFIHKEHLKHWGEDSWQFELKPAFRHDTDEDDE